MSTNTYKITSWKGKSSSDERAEAVELYAELGSIPKVCVRMDRNYETIRRWLKQAGVDTSTPKTKQTKSELIAELKAENEELRDIIAQLAQLHK